jgi:hypothetical protein
MARRNIEEYQRVLTILDSKNYKDKDGYVMLSSIESIFVAITDKVRPETIKAHIDQMCRLKLLTKKGELSYEISMEWKEIISKFI